jgi:hypothetical protein
MLRFQVGDIDGKFKITFFINEVLDKLLFHAAWSFHKLFDKVEAPFRVEVEDSAPTVKIRTRLFPSICIVAWE